MFSKSLTLVFLISSVASSQGASLQKYRLRAGSFGPAKIGMSVAQASKSLGIKLLAAPEMGDVDESCHYVFPRGRVKSGIAFMVENNKITRIDISSAAFASIDNIRVGDSEEEVKSKSRLALTQTEHPYLDNEGAYLISTEENGLGFIYESAHGKLTSFRAGRAASIKYIEGCL